MAHLIIEDGCLYDTVYVCSACRTMLEDGEDLERCPICGAKFEREDEA